MTNPQNITMKPVLKLWHCPTCNSDKITLEGQDKTSDGYIYRFTCNICKQAWGQETVETLKSFSLPIDRNGKIILDHIITANWDDNLDGDYKEITP